MRYRHGQQRKRIETQPWTDPTKISEESSEDATSAEQERHSKALTSGSGQSQVKEGKIPGDNRRSALQPGP